MTIKTLLSDERGDLSSARCSFWMVLLYTVTMLTLSKVGIVDPFNGAELALLTTMFMVTSGWAAGPRMAQYLFPQIGSTVKAVSDGWKQKMDNFRKDDERGE